MQIALGSILHNNVKINIVTERFKEFDYVRMVDFTEDSYFRTSLPGGMFLNACKDTLMELM